MRRNDLFYLLGLASVLLFSGCVVRTYPLTRERVDQDLTTGNRGYLQGQASGEEKERKTTRTTRVVEVELYPPVRFDRTKKAKPAPREEMPQEAGMEEETEDLSLEGNRGYVSESEIPETAAKESAPAFEKYTVQKGDTLQKISQRFFGTTKKWNKIYEANQDVLKGPNKIYPGQIINIPVDPLKGPGRNLK